jgi:hypothetical protein
MLKALKLHGVGPTKKGLSASFAERLNVLTGDNGLGKSFLLDISFWALTGQWPGGRTAIPDGSTKSPTISYDIQSKTKPASRVAKYDFKSQTWSRQPGRPPMPGLVIYAAVDGGFAVWDPARNYWRPSAADFVGTSGQAESEGPEQPRAYQFTAGTLADGLREKDGRVLCKGLIDDWVNWYYQRTSSSSSSEPSSKPASSSRPSASSESSPRVSSSSVSSPLPSSSSAPSRSAFGLLEAVIAELSHPQEPMSPAKPARVFLNDTREYPVLQLPYGTVAYPHWPAGVKRVVGLAYLLVWSWCEHAQAAELRHEEPTDRIILLVDEIESHLHPKWQRTIVPALLKVTEKLRAKLHVQMELATHSPLALASLEPYFDAARDRLFWFDLQSGVVHLKEYPWAIQGDVVGWLTSEIFGLEQARSQEAEKAIEAAEAFMRGEKTALPEGLRTEEQIDEALRKYLPGMDRFWPRWSVEVEA